MMRYVFHLSEPIWMKCCKNKRIELTAETFEKAKDKVISDNPGWRISMFWYVWP